jgi:uncharacterized protein with GYD domain
MTLRDLECHVVEVSFLRHLGEEILEIVWKCIRFHIFGRAEHMPTYISLINLTEQGVREAKNAPERLQAFESAVKEVGGRLIGFYLVMGQYDYIVITEAPDDQTAARLILGTIAQGSMRTQTMRAFPREEFEQIARGLR